MKIDTPTAKDEAICIYIVYCGFYATVEFLTYDIEEAVGYVESNIVGKYSEYNQTLHDSHNWHIYKNQIGVPTSDFDESITPEDWKNMCLLKEVTPEMKRADGVEATNTVDGISVGVSDNTHNDVSDKRRNKMRR